MKRLVLTVAILAGFALGGMAQNVWKPINIPGTLKGVAANGDLFIGETGIQRSQDEGESWQIVLEGTYYNGNDGFTISPNGRIFDLPYNENHLCISDDGGDTWRNSPDFLYSPLENAPMYAVSNDTLFLYQAEGDTLLWTLDGGNTWDRTCLSFLDHDQSSLGPWFGAMLADEAGNVYIGTWGWAPPESGVFQANLDNMNEWSLIISDSYVQSLVFDIEGNIVIDCPAVANNGIFFSTQRIDGDSMVLTYSTDHGVNYTPIGEGLPSTQTVPETGLRLFKGGDQHLYCHGDIWSGGTITQTQYYKSIRKADYILENFPLENTAWVQFYRSMYEDSTYYQLGIKGDTVVNEMAYKKVINCAHLGYPIDGECFGGIREDGDGKCYFMSFVDAIFAPWPLHYDCEANTEYPLYDFSLSVCDVFQTIGLTPHVVFDTAEMELNGSMRKVLWFGNNCDNGNSYYCQWIEGIGSTHSLLYPIQDEPDNGPEYRLVEVWQDEELLYRNPHFEEDFPYDNTRWSIYYQNLYLDWAPYIQIGMIGDTIVDGATYHKMIKCTSYGNLIDGDCFGGIRVEADGKWYFRLFTDENVPQYLYLDMEPNTERLLYDFSLSECDRFYFEGDLYNDPEYWMSVFDIDEIEINGSMRRRLWFDSNCEEGNHPYDWNWIEGIGSNFGLLYSIQAFPLDGSNYHLGEVYQDGELIYRDPYFIDEPSSPEWYYEIQNENGSITYQYLYQAGDTIIQDEPTHILVRINTLYDKDVHTDVTHEYVYERDGKLYWWNKTMEVFTVLYDFEAEVGDYWEIIVGTRPIDMHVDAVEEIEYEGRTYRMLRVSDPEDLFSGNIVCGIGHLTSFFPERLMNNGDGVRVEGMRCYWVDDELVFKYGDEDCDAIYSDIHGVEEDGPLTGLEVYPNPTDGVLFVETHGRASLSNQTYRITNLMGQTLLTDQITAETQQIDVTGLAEGMYFITSAGETRKFVVR